MAEHTKTEDNTPISQKPDQGNNDLKDLLSNLSTILKRTTASNRSIPSWDSSSTKHGVSIKSHIKLFENLADRMDWNEDEKALELLLTFKGQSRKYVESLSSDITKDFKKLKEDLIKTYTRSKPEAQRLREWNSARWDTKKQTLTEFAAMLMAKLKKLNEDELGNPDTDLFLKNRFIEAIKDENPEFGRYLDLNRPEKPSFQELVKFCQSKYDVFCAVEREDEERKESEIFFNAENDRKNSNVFQQNYQPQMPFPFFYPFPFMHPNMFNMNDKNFEQHKQHFPRFTDKNSKEKRWRNDRLKNFRQDANKAMEKTATKVPKDHKIEYIKDSKKNNQKNL